jgi:uncharacterized protein YciI
MKDRYDKLKAKGRCVTCGRRKAVDGTLRCEKDREAAAGTAKRIHIRARPAEGDGNNSDYSYLQDEEEEDE